MKKCNKCKHVLPEGSFGTRQRRGRTVLLSRCIECTREDNRVQQRAWSAKPGNKERARGWALQREYGITLVDWQAKLAAQGGLCAVCKQPMTEKINVDHDHATGAIRDLLCSPCNGGLGCFRDDPELLAAAEAYLQRWRKR